MEIGAIKETAILLTEGRAALTEEEKQFVIQFAFKTEDKELTNKLIDELIMAEGDRSAIITRFQTQLDPKPEWLEQIENLLVSVELYRLEEEKALKQLTDVLGAYGIDVSVEELQKSDTKAIKEMIKTKTI